MGKYELNPSQPATLSPEAMTRLARLSDEDREARAFSAEHPATTDEELDRAVAARRVRMVRLRHKLSAEEFSRILCVPVGNLLDWEDGRQVPDAAALALVTVFDREPEAFRRALG